MSGWITIGADKSQPEGERGGTPVFIGRDGDIEKGPKSLEGRNIESVDKGKQQTKGESGGYQGPEGANPVPQPRKMWQEQKPDHPEAIYPSAEEHPHSLSQLGERVRAELLNWMADAHEVAKPIGWAAAGARRNFGDEKKAKQDAYQRIEPADLQRIQQQMVDILQRGANAGSDLRPFIRHNNLVPRELVPRLKPNDQLFRPAKERERYQAIAEVVIERYAAEVEQYRESDGQWITIGADKDAKKGEKGGTPVFIGPGGTIQKGPRQLEGHRVDQLNKVERRKKRPEFSKRQLDELGKLREEDRQRREQGGDNRQWRNEYFERRNRIVGDTERRRQEYDMAERRKEAQAIYDRRKELSNRPAHELTRQEHAIVEQARKYDAAERDQRKFGELAQQYLSARENGNWPAVDATLKQMSKTRGYGAMSKRAKEVMGTDVPAAVADYLTKYKRPDDVALLADSYETRQAHEAAVRAMVEKHPDRVPSRVAKDYQYHDWMPAPKRERIQQQEEVERWERAKDSKEWRQKARTGRNLRRTANAAVDHYRKQMIDANLPGLREAGQKLREAESRIEQLEKQWEQQFGNARELSEADEKSLQPIIDELSDQAEKRNAAKDELKQRSADALIESLGGPAGSTLPSTGAEKLPVELQGRVQEARDWLSKVLPQEMVPTDLKFELLPPGQTRAYCRGQTVVLSPHNSVATVVHEIGHAIEHARGDVTGEKSKAFLAAMTFDQRVDHLGRSYGTTEVATQDGFQSAYTGKYYQGSGSTEILSMGLQNLYSNPRMMAEEAPDHFNYTVAAVRGMI